MRYQNPILYAFICSLLYLSSVSAQDVNESPYFFIKNKDSKVEQFPLLSTYIHSNIIGPMADVTVTQKYHNQGTEPIEAKYVFPASTRSAVYAMQMKIGKRVIQAEIQEKKKAKATYEQAKKEGKRASLLEQELPNVFQMSVSNIMPGDIIEVEMKFTEFIIPSDQTYEWVFPTVVGPRFNGEKKMPVTHVGYIKKGGTNKATFDINVSLNTSIPIQKISCLSHKTIKNKISDKQTDIYLHSKSKNQSDRDFILQYNLSDKKVQTGIITHSVGKEKYFLCQVEPPKMEHKPVIVPREYIFILDVSGSMRGRPLEITKTLMKNLLGGLRSTDKYNVLTFAGSAGLLYPSSQSVSKQGLRESFDKILKLKGGGGTHMLHAINTALDIPKEEGYSRSFVIMTDGYVTVDQQVFSLIQRNLHKANFFSLGIGTSVNRNIIEGIAHVGRGEPFVVTDFKYAKPAIDRLKKYIEAPLMTGIKITGQGVELYDLIPEQAPDLMAERPIYYFGKYRNVTGEASLNIEATKGCQAVNINLPLPDHRSEEPLLKYLWAREKIRFLDDFNGLEHSEKRKEEITKLGLKYNLLTQYTSFVAVDKYKANNSKQLETVNTPLPLPHHVENSAIGMEMTLEEIFTDYTNRPTSFIVEASCKEKVNQQMIETIIESYIYTLDKKEIEALFQTENTIHVIHGQCIVDDQSEAYIVLCKYLMSTLESLGVYNLDETFEIHFSVKN